MTKPTARRMPERFELLAQYNAEKARGIQHALERQLEMGLLQQDFDRWIAEDRPVIPINIPGGYLGQDVAVQMIGDQTRWRYMDSDWSSWFTIPKPSWWRRILNWRRG